MRGIQKWKGCVGLVATLAWCTNSVHAQTVQGLTVIGETARTRAAEYMFNSYPGQSVVPVSVLGSVTKPGIYYVPAKTELVTLLTLAGGVTDEADADRIRLRRAKNDTALQPISLEKLIDSAQYRGPTVDANDLVFVPTEKPWISSNTMRVITVLSVIASVALTSVLISERLRD